MRLRSADVRFRCGYHPAGRPRRVRHESNWTVCGPSAPSSPSTPPGADAKPAATAQGQKKEPGQKAKGALSSTAGTQ